jgi:hypothetical protein
MVKLIKVTREIKYVFPLSYFLLSTFLVSIGFIFL